MNKGLFNNPQASPQDNLCRQCQAAEERGWRLWETPAHRSPFPGAGKASREQLPAPWGLQGGCCDGLVWELRARTAPLLLQPEVSCLVLCSFAAPHSFFHFPISLKSIICPPP